MDKIVRFGDYKHLVGVLSEGVNKRPDIQRPCVIILNAGLVHRVGPNRIYVKLARLLAQHGVSVLRFDLPGVGDSVHRKDNLTYEQSVNQEIKTAMDFLSEKAIASKFILTGICSGANNSLLAAFKDRRIIGAAPINYQPPDTEFGRALHNSAFYTDIASANIISWKRFLFGKSSYRNIFKAVFTRMRMWVLPQTVYALDDETGENIKWVKKVLKTLYRRNLKLLMISSDGETGYYYIKQVARSDVMLMMKKGLLKFKIISGADHMFTQLESQKMLLETFLQWILTFQDDYPIQEERITERPPIMAHPSTS